MSAPARFGRYRVDRRIGSGAFATVWLARDEVLDAPVAVKVLADNWAHRLDVRERFEEEARILRRADSDRVVRVHDIGELEDGRPYFVMTYADGGTLADRLTGGPLPVADALRYGADIARGLAVVHQVGVIHRDVNPRNVLLRTGRDGTAERVLVADLGLAKAAAQGSGFTLTVGTPGYMAPEQARPGEVPLDRRADVYAVGAVLHHMLTGVAPGPDEPPPAVRSLRPEVPEPVAALVTQALATRPEDRFPSAGALADALDAAAVRLRRTPERSPGEGSPGERPAERSPVERSPGERPAERSPAERSPAEPPAEPPAERSPAERSPAERSPAERPAERSPGERSLGERPAERSPGERSPAEGSPGERPAERSPAEGSPGAQSSAERLVERPAETPAERSAVAAPDPDDTLTLALPRPRKRRGRLVLALVAVLLLLGGAGTAAVLVLRDRGDVTLATTDGALRVTVPRDWAGQVQHSPWDLRAFGLTGPQGVAVAVAPRIADWEDLSSDVPGVFAGRVAGTHTAAELAKTPLADCPVAGRRTLTTAGLSGTVTRRTCAGSAMAWVEAVLQPPDASYMVYVQVKQPGGATTADDVLARLVVS